MLCVLALFAGTARAEDEDESSLNIKVSAEVMDGGVYYLDDSHPLNGLLVGFRLAPRTNPGGSGKVATTLGSVSVRQ
jgi:hypothetical protein